MASAYMFSHYWPGDGGSAPSADPQPHAQWQSSTNVMLHSGVGLVPPPSLLGTRLALLARVVRWIFSPQFEHALAVVKDVAHTPHLNANDQRAWDAISLEAVRRPGTGENLFRTLLAQQKYGQDVPGHRDVRDTLLQLAYVSYKKA